MTSRRRNNSVWRQPWMPILIIGGSLTVGAMMMFTVIALLLLLSASVPASSQPQQSTIADGVSVAEIGRAHV